MAAMSRSLALAFFFFFFLCSASIVSADDSFLQCLSASIPSQLLYTQSSPSYTSVLDAAVRNPKFLTNTTRPVWIITPTNASHVQAAVLCGRRNSVRLRIRSGGHDYEGLSYRSERPEVFAVLDLVNVRSVRVDAQSGTAWVDSGATLGEMYYAIGKAGGQIAFPGGLCPTVGVGGHFSGGGFGMLLRKYGLAADNVIDAVLVDAKGRLLDKNSMGSDVFWAIRGGAGESFGIVLSWKVKLVAVPPTVTVFNIPVTVNKGAIDVLTRWQAVAPALPDDLFIRVLVQGQTASFQSLYLGTCDALLPVMRSRFPELGMNRSDCKEMTWIKSVPYIYLGSSATVEDILNRTISMDTSNKATSDYVRQVIPKDVWTTIFGWLARPNAGLMILDPYGGQIGSVPESATPFPHRGGVLYNIQYMNFWSAGGSGDAQRAWISDFYAFMAPHVSSSPREAYANYRDLDLGENVVGAGGVSGYDAGKVWGEKYFRGNYQRLAMAKGQIDPDDYFRNEQSIPPLVSGK
ncbi:berberine bridge enzyme-like Cyn d 4 [Oryza brachyantha]|uniref:FAD-binding PCMH-type domain-containing protein n=1 Tax=Oryza brachyantha TaxID=4533 RepID=J3MEX1_ORYBR|nr:berberine bridge enzyme-like Cyn d 4 [Oryza brachyantha]